MFLKYFYDQELAHASYLVGCQKSGEAIVVDPGRLVQQYYDVAEQEGFQITGVAETHIHADYISGARELADRGAKLYLSDEGPLEWKYDYVKEYSHQLLKDGDQFSLGKIEFTVLHTPGHTPESVSFLLTDKGGGADKPMGIFSGDFIFVGSIGRPDLLEEAAGVRNSAEPGARDLYQSIKKFEALPDFVQVWPAHGSGSACGKGLGAIPSSTVGYEKAFNPALQFHTETEFVDFILKDQPEAPKYFGEMKRVNKLGPALLADLEVQADLEIDAIDANSQIIDIRAADEFALQPIPHAINIPLSMFAKWAGWFVDYSRPLFVVAVPDQFHRVQNMLAKIGIDNFAGFLNAEKISLGSFESQPIEKRKPIELAESVFSGDVTLVDVRNDQEWNQERIQGANHHFLGRLIKTLNDIPKNKPVVVQCLSGGRSAIAASLFHKAGFDVIDMVGGISLWKQSQLEVESQQKVLTLQVT